MKYIPYIVIVISILLFSGWFVVTLFHTPQEDSVVSVDEGISVRQTAQQLEQQGLISSAEMFELLLRVRGNVGVVAGNYHISDDKNLWEITSMMRLGDYGVDPVRVTFPEGYSIKEMADRLADELSVTTFDKDNFLKLALPQEGFLFPDTYFFSPLLSEEEVVEKMRDNFEARFNRLGYDQSLNILSQQDIITLASLVEEEANTQPSRRLVAGILLNRLQQDLPLQVDAAFLYIPEVEGRNTYELTVDDLQVDSPYNTYLYKGLPPTPISNPGMASIKAVLNPTDTDYLFYLTGDDGNMYYARNFEEHKENRQKYL